MAAEATQQDKSVVTINGEEHNVSDLSQEQMALLDQVLDLDRKIGQMGFSLAQVQGAKNFFMGQLTASLEERAEPEEEKS